MTRAPGDYTNLTVKQADLLSYLRTAQAQNFTPTYDEMAGAMGIVSRGNIHRLVTALVERGYVERTQYGVRSIRVRERRLHPDEIGKVDLTKVPAAALLAELRRRVPAMASHL